MRYSKLPAQTESRDMVAIFGGYNHNLRIGAGEFYDMENMTGQFYPLLAPRVQRGFYTGGADIKAILAKDQLCYVDGTDVVIGQTKYQMGLDPEGEKTVVSMGAYLVVFPDGRYINTARPEDKGSLEASFSAEGATLSMCTLDGADITPGEKSETPNNGDYWMDGNTLKQYSSANNLWVSVSTTYIKITAEGIGKRFEAGDGVRLDGIQGLDGSLVIQKKDRNYLVVIGAPRSTVTLYGTVTVRRSVPVMDYVVEAGNRLWGCRYGTDKAGSFVNELYASKLGDFKNWECFQGLSTDSYRASLGSDGPFTGAITHLGYPLFFKENQMHKVYGSYPANFQIQSDACRGVQKGSHRSLAIVGEILYYKSRLGVCAYDGSLPVEVSAALGEDHYRDAVAGSHGGKYYISMADDAGQYNLFVYDTVRRFWHKEDHTKALMFASYDNELYFIDGGDKQIKTVFGTGSARYTAPVEWMVESGLLGVDDPDHKYISRIQIRMQLELNAVIHVSIQYDSSEEWEHAGTVKGSTTKTFTMPVRPKRCDHLRLKIQGRGNVKIFSITKTTQKGS